MSLRSQNRSPSPEETLNTTNDRVFKYQGARLRLLKYRKEDVSYVLSTPVSPYTKEEPVIDYVGSGIESPNVPILLQDRDVQISFPFRNLQIKNQLMNEVNKRKEVTTMRGFARSQFKKPRQLGRQSSLRKSMSPPKDESPKLPKKVQSVLLRYNMKS